MILTAAVDWLTHSVGRSDIQDLAVAALEASYDSILITDADLDHPRIVYVNPAFCQMTGWGREEVLGKTPAILQGEETDRAVTQRLRRALEAGHEFEGRTINYRKDGQRFHIEWRTSPVRNHGGEVTHYLAIQRDITAQVRLLRRLQERADSDALTDLLNRDAGERALRAQIQKAGESEQPLSIVLLDIDHFKPINDEHGHGMGDLVLERIGRLITQRLNRQDFGMRWGGEEFMLVLLDTALEEAGLAAEAFRKLIATTGFHDEIRVTASFGVAQWRPGEDVDALFDRADAALYEAKRDGRDRVCLADR
ncbi:MAG: diguanylate cyclase [Gammaproteobacteria bacterium]|jgi:diguanylate cyclase (GGDEF)-like protein/PAS domain S-box-containing protein|nr:diguanylate cyclase [Gammaproteobacteria bacterium]